MEPVTGVKIAVPRGKNRKPLQVLQPAATDKEILVGADRILTQSKGTKTKQDVTEAVKKGVSKSIKVTKKNKAVQTVREEKTKIKVEDLTSTENPSENYWQILAEKRRMALVDALEENKKLVQRIEKLEEENHIYKEWLDETRTLVEVLQEQIENDGNDINSLNDSTF